jgi:cell division protease FtsH
MNLNNPRTKNILIYAVIGLVLLLLFLSMGSSATQSTEVQFTDLVDRIHNKDVASIRVVGDELYVDLTNSNRFHTQKSPETTAQEQLLELGVTSEELSQIEWSFDTPSNLPAIGISILTALLPILLIGGLIYYMMRQSQGSNNQAISFGKSRARMFTGERTTITFEDVAGADEAKAELAEVVEFLKEPEKFLQLGARIPKGILLVGSPGTGKTLLGKAVAGEAGVPFFSISGSEFVEMFVGVGASRVRDLFDQARRHSPCIVFIDEIDAVGRHRGAGLGGSHDEREQTLNQILVEMDGFDTDTNVIILAATNRPDILDPALTRPGRFDRRVVLDRPDVKGREAILKVHSRGKPLAPDVDMVGLAKSTPGFVGADIENMVNEAAILAARKNRKVIAERDFQEAIERVLMGPERRSRLITKEEQRITAYHEAGHAVVAYLQPGSDPVRKVTIIPRGMSLGLTSFMPDEILNTSRSRIRRLIVTALGGRVAEEIVFDDITTGAADDLERVTGMARAMVTRFGMSDKLGPMIFGKKEEMVFLGREIAEQRDYSEAIAEEIDKEVQNIIKSAHAEAYQLLTENRDKLNLVAERLLEVETLDGAAFLALIEGAPEESHSPAAEKARPARENTPSRQEENRGNDRPPLETAPSPV